jgi:hypothetical protein
MSVDLDQLLSDEGIDYAENVFVDFYLKIYDSRTLLGSPEFRAEVEKTVRHLVDGAAA